MRAVVVRAFGEPQAFEVEEVPDPVPGPGEVLVGVHTAALTFGDSLIATGRYQVRPHLPFTPGSEGSGVVEAVGPGVTAVRPGDHVAAMGFVGASRTERSVLGTCAEKVVVPVRNLALVPAAVPLEQAALFRSNAETGWLALRRGGLRPGETLLVLGAGGGTGYAAVELGKVVGAHVIGSASSDARRALALAAGADAVVDSGDPDWRRRISDLTGGRGPDVVYDPVGDAQTERAFRSLAYGGRLLVVGFAAGSIPALPTNLALLKGTSLVGVNLLLAWEQEPERIAQDAEQLLRWFGEGRLSVPPVAARFPLAEAAAAYAAVQSGATAGRVILEVAPR